MGFNMRRPSSPRWRQGSSRRKPATTPDTVCGVKRKEAQAGHDPVIEAAEQSGLSGRRLSRGIEPRAGGDRWRPCGPLQLAHAPAAACRAPLDRYVRVTGGAALWRSKMTERDEIEGRSLDGSRVVLLASVVTSSFGKESFQQDSDSAAGQRGHLQRRRLT